MKITLFVLAVLATAAAIVGLVHLAGLPPETTPAEGAALPLHAFLPASADADTPIACPLADGVTVDEVMSSKPPACWLTDG